MAHTSNEFTELVPASDAELALLRMPQKARLPRYKPNSLHIGEDCDASVKALIRSIGLPNS